MPFNGSGTFALPTPEYPAQSGTTILAGDFNTILDDVADGLTDCVTRDGQSALTASLPMGGFGLTGLGNGAAATPILRWGTNDGFYSAGTNKVDVAIAGAKVAEWTAAGSAITGNITASGSITASGGDITASGNMYAATPASASDNTTKVPTTTWVNNAISAQASGFTSVTMATPTIVSGTTQAAVAGGFYVLTNVAATTVTLPSTPSAGDTVWVCVANTLTTNVVARGGEKIFSAAEDLTLDALRYGTIGLRYTDATRGWYSV